MTQYIYLIDDEAAIRSSLSALLGTVVGRRRRTTAPRLSNRASVNCMR